MTRSSRKRFLGAALSLSLWAGTAAPATIDPTEALAQSQAVLGQRVSNYTFADAKGGNVQLHDFLGRPLVLSLVFTSCHHVCPTLTSELERAAAVAAAMLGPDAFAVLTIGFDTANDTPDRMARYARERGIDAANWHFLSTDAATMRRFAEEIGFRFAPIAGGFDHLARTTIVAADGHIYRHLYGASIHPETFSQPLRELAIGEHIESGNLGDWLRGVKLLCTVYDPSTGRYEVDYSIFMAIFTGALCLGLVAVFLFRLWRPTPAE